MSLADIVNVQITTETGAVLQAGFGVPLILSAHNINSDRIRFYTQTADMLSDGFLSSSPEVKAASALFAQNPRPERVAVGRRDNRPTQAFTLTPVVGNAASYRVKLNGQVAAFVSDASATLAEVTAGLAAALTALAVPNVTVADAGTAVTLTGAAPGVWFDVESLDVSRLAVAQTHAAADPAADLAAILAADASWYGVVSLFNSSAEVAAIAGWVEANGKLFIAQTNDSAVLTAATDDVASVLKTGNYARTALIYSPSLGAFADAAWLGRCLPFDPGSETWKFKTLAGVPSTQLTATQVTNLRGKNANFYYTVAGRAITAEGMVAAGEFIDTIRGRDWFQARTQERIYMRLANAKKLAMTDAGIAVIEAEVRAQIQDGIDVGFLAADPEPVVRVPRASALSSTDKAARHLRGITFDAVIAGAIHKLTLNGTIRV